MQYEQSKINKSLNQIHKEVESKEKKKGKELNGHIFNWKILFPYLKDQQ
jgi:hypothetical protein